MSVKEQINHSKTAIIQFWKAQSKKRRIIFFSVLAGIILLSVILALLLHKESYSVLYTNLESSESSEILGELKNMNIDAKVDKNGTISVPQSKENNARMVLATKGYPKTTLSYDIWTKNINMFTTDSDKKQYAKMQLQNRLQDTIATLSDVESSIVTLDIPNTSNNVLSESTDKPTASVVLHLRSGRQLSSDQIKGITHIVARSISGLDEKSVTITDGTGKPLNIKDDTVDSVVQETQKLEFKRDFEDALKKEVLNLLIPSYGNNGVKVAVNADLDYDKKVSENTEYTPSVDKSGMVQNESTEERKGGTGTEGGTVGVQPNADGTYPTGDTTVSDGAWSENKKTTSYLVNTLKTQSEKQGYYVKSVKVSVVVYKDQIGEQERLSIVNVATNAVGTTNDLVNVESLPKYEERINDANKNANNKSSKEILGFSITAIIIASMVLVFIIIVVLTILLIVRHKRKMMLKQLEEEEKYLKEQEEKENEVKKLSENVPETKEQAIRNEISDFSERSPEIAAQLLKNWLREDEK